jgi:hypothetical protein
MKTSPIAVSIAASPRRSNVEERPEDRSLPRGTGQRAVEDVRDRSGDEEDAAEPEEEVLVPFLEADQHRPRDAEREPGYREHVGCQLRARDALHRAPQDLPRGRGVLLLDAI